MGIDFYIDEESVDEPHISPSGIADLKEASPAFDRFMRLAVQDGNPIALSYQAYAHLIPELKRDLRKYGKTESTSVQSKWPRLTMDQVMSGADNLPPEEYVPTRLSQVLGILECAAESRSPIRIE